MEALTCGLASAQVETAWVRRYDGPASGFDYAMALAVDASGSVLVTGQSRGSSGGDGYATIKYNSIGDTQWVRRYDGPGDSTDEALALTVDGSGNVYVTGYGVARGGYADYVTVKYSSSGDTQWVRRYDGPGGSADLAWALAVDGSGNVYVTGQSSNDYATIKYNAGGDTQWVRRYDGPTNGYECAQALAIDGSGNVYVTGQSGGLGSGMDYATIKYNSSGDTQWVRRYNGPGNSVDVAYALAVDDSGNAYVTGRSYGGTGSSDDYATVKYTASGDTQWVRRYDGPANDDDWAWAVAADVSGNVYVTGESHGGTGTSYDYATIKYNAGGDTQWVRRYDGPANGPDYASALAVDGSGNVYVTGQSSNDYATIKYNAGGDTQWVRRYDGPATGSDYANALAVDGSGNVYVTGGSVGPGSGNDYATIKYVQTGGVAQGPVGCQRRRVGPTIVRGVLVLGAVGSRQDTAVRVELLDISGRKVLDLHTGANDVSRLSPGVYFVRAVSREPSAVSRHKVVVAE